MHNQEESCQNVAAKLFTFLYQEIYAKFKVHLLSVEITREITKFKCTLKFNLFGKELTISGKSYELYDCIRRVVSRMLSKIYRLCSLSVHSYPSSLDECEDGYPEMLFGEISDICSQEEAVAAA